MPEKDPTTWSIATWALVVIMSFLGGITSWYRRVKSGHTRAFNIIELIGEAAVSGFMGFTGFIAGLWYFGSEGMAAVAGGWSAHFATRILFSAEGLIEISFKQLSKKIRGY